MEVVICNGTKGIRSKEGILNIEKQSRLDFLQTSIYSVLTLQHAATLVRLCRRLLSKRTSVEYRASDAEHCDVMNDKSQPWSFPKANRPENLTFS